MFISVIIKALNEELKIERCIKSVIQETKGHNVEIILVDSCSTDNTVAIAGEYPVKIVQFRHVEDANCGAAVQLGYQVASGNYIYIIDADMEMSKGFFNKALVYLETHDNVAGVSGLIEDTVVTSFSDRRRKNLYSSIESEVLCKSLGGGGLYRKKAVESVEYFGHRSLESCEELELGVRLQDRGWQLVRLPYVAVSHTGHGLSDFELVLRYFKAGRFKSIGKAIKSSFNKKWLFSFLEEFKYLFVAALLVIIPIFIAIFFSFFIGLFMFPALILFVCLLLSVKKKSVRDAVVSICTWYLTLSHVLVGIFAKVKSPREIIEYVIINK